MCEEVIGDEVGKPGRGPGHESHGRCDKKFGLYPEDHKKPLKDSEQEDNMLKCVLSLTPAAVSSVDLKGLCGRVMS